MKIHLTDPDSRLLSANGGNVRPRRKRDEGRIRSLTFRRRLLEAVSISRASHPTLEGRGRSRFATRGELLKAGQRFAAEQDEQKLGTDLRTRRCRPGKSRDSVYIVLRNRDGEKERGELARSANRLPDLWRVQGEGRRTPLP